MCSQLEPLIRKKDGPLLLPSPVQQTSIMLQPSLWEKRREKGKCVHELKVQLLTNKSPLQEKERFSNAQHITTDRTTHITRFLSLFSILDLPTHIDYHFSVCV